MGHLEEDVPQSSSLTGTVGTSGMGGGRLHSRVAEAKLPGDASLWSVVLHRLPRPKWRGGESVYKGGVPDAKH